MKRLLLALMFAVLISASASASSSYVGIYATPQGTARIEGVLTGVAERQHLELIVSVVNEVGSELYAPGGLPSMVRVEIAKDDAALPADSLDLTWQKDERFSIAPDLPSEPSVAGILEPGVGLRSRLSVARADGRSFGEGRYEIELSLVEKGLLRSDGSSWHGRGGALIRRFELQHPKTPEEQQWARKMRAREAFYDGRFADAKRLFESAAVFDGNDIGAWTGISRAQLALGDYAGASRTIERLLPELRGSGQETSLPVLLAEARLHLGDRAGAVAALKSFVAEAFLAPTLEKIELRVRLTALESPEPRRP